MEGMSTSSFCIDRSFTTGCSYFQPNIRIYEDYNTYVRSYICHMYESVNEYDVICTCIHM